MQKSLFLSDHMNTKISSISTRPVAELEREGSTASLLLRNSTLSLSKGYPLRYNLSHFVVINLMNRFNNFLKNWVIIILDSP